MKHILYLTLFSFIVSCSNKINFTRKITRETENQKDSLENLRYMYLQGFATCKCVYAVPENNTGRELDISPAIFADIVNFWGIDTLGILAIEEAQKIKALKYKDYQNKKPTFIHCYEWVNSPRIDSLIRTYAKASAEEWNQKERSRD